MTVTCRSREDWSAEDERARLEEVAEWYDSRRGVGGEMARFAAARILARAKGTRALELGCANGVITEELARRFGHLDVVEGAERYARAARAIVGFRGRVHRCLFEELEATERYDVIVMSWVLEHVAEPRDLLARAREWLLPTGQVHIVAPNAESLHRRVGLEMGLLGRLDELNESDLAIGHRRVYTWGRLAGDIEAAGLRLVSMEGILLKPLPSALMESWGRELRAAFFELGRLAPRLCSEIYAVCGRPDHGNTTDSADGLR